MSSTTLQPTDLCSDCLTRAEEIHRTQQSRDFIRRLYNPTWRERVEDFYVNYILRRYVIWFGDYTDDYTLEQRIAQRLPWNIDRYSNQYSQEQLDAFSARIDRVLTAQGINVEGLREGGQRENN